MNKSTLRLFNAVLIDEVNNQPLDSQVVKRAFRNGYVLSPRIIPTENLLGDIESVLGISGVKANAAFHKSWKVVQDSDLETLVLQQIFHYMTTYGAEFWGTYREELVFIPHEQLDLPELEKDLPLIVVQGLTADELRIRCVDLGSGIALGKETLDDLMVVFEGLRLTDREFVYHLGNRELKTRLYDLYNMVPKDPEEYLRYVVSKLTDESLLIKNRQLIWKLENANGKFLDTLLKDAPKDLASIFFRYKPLFLAMKRVSRNKRFFNQLRRQADDLHKPLPVDYLNNVTAQIKQGTLQLGELQDRLANASVFRKIRLAYALSYRCEANSSIVYRVRNGRSWATEFNWRGDAKLLIRAFDLVIQSIAEGMRKNVDGKVIYIPEYVHYALPATEKQFTGNFPSGTYVTVPEDLIVGIHWTDTKDRIDLDLSLIGASGKLGWDRSYRTADRTVLFSGDMTAAPEPHGASELFYLKGADQEPRIIFVNYFNYIENNPVECKVLVAHESPEGNFGKSYVVDVNKIVAQANTVISQRQNVLGLVTRVGGENRIYFAQSSIGNSITSYGSSQTDHARNYLVASMTQTINLEHLLVRAGALVVKDLPEEGEYINLAPEALDKQTIIDLVR